MKTLIAALSVTTALTVPAMVAAAPVTFDTQLNDFGWGRSAYLAYYVTDASGKYVGSLWMAGSRSRYYRHLGGWYRYTGGDTRQVSGLTGASVGSGRSLSFTLNLADTLFDAGYVIHIDAASENMRQNTSEITVPLTTANLGKATTGRGYVGSFTYSK